MSIWLAPHPDRLNEIISRRPVTGHCRVRMGHPLSQLPETRLVCQQRHSVVVIVVKEHDATVTAMFKELRDVFVSRAMWSHPPA